MVVIAEHLNYNKNTVPRRWVIVRHIVCVSSNILWILNCNCRWFCFLQHLLLNYYDFAVQYYLLKYEASRTKVMKYTNSVLYFLGLSCFQSEAIQLSLLFEWWKIKIILFFSLDNGVKQFGADDEKQEANAKMTVKAMVKSYF